jgi:hypothetical protein
MVIVVGLVSILWIIKMGSKDTLNSPQLGSRLFCESRNLARYIESLAEDIDQCRLFVLV